MQRLRAAMMALAAAALLHPVAATAQSSGRDDEIVVEAKRRDALRKFVERLAQAGPTDQLGRWKQTICPSVAGIAPDQARLVEDRIVEVARSVGLTRQARCLPDLVIIITPQADAFAAQLAKDFPRDDGQIRINRFLRNRHVARWLTITNECADGCELRNSRLANATTPAFAGFLILIDAARLDGYQLGELADYAAFVGLSNPQQNPRNPNDSILSMFDDPHPKGIMFVMSDSDRAFLSALYRTQIRGRGAAQKNAIANDMKDRLDAPAPKR